MLSLQIWSEDLVSRFWSCIARSGIVLVAGGLRFELVRFRKIKTLQFLLQFLLPRDIN